MHDDLQKAIQDARGGGDAHFDALVALLIGEARSANRDLFVELLKSDETLVRRAAVNALKRGLLVAELKTELSALVDDPDEQVRACLAAIAGDRSSWHDPSLLRRLLRQNDYAVCDAALEASKAWPELIDDVVSLVGRECYWGLRCQAAERAADAPAEIAIPRLCQALAHDDDTNVQRACAASIEAHLNRNSDEVENRLTDQPFHWLRRSLERMTEFEGDAYPRLLRCLERRCEGEVDVARLKTFGAVLTEPATLAELPRGHQLEKSIDEIRDIVTGEGLRSVVLMGPSGCGKTTVVNELCRQLSTGIEPWTVLRVSPSEFLRNTKYLGEWQTRAADIVAQIKAPRRAILYVPNLELLNRIGATDNHDDNVAMMLAPLIERGEIAVIGESTEEAFNQGLGRDPSLKRLFQVARVIPADDERTADLVRLVANDLNATLPRGFVDRLLELSDLQSVETAQPGRAVELLRRVVEGHADLSVPLAENEILDTISASTGLPRDLLDDERRLDLVATRAFFETRVMGQPEAIDAAIDLVTLIKARLTDPHRPFGVLMFVGPTGVGKTELAKALAEFCFGDSARLQRLDMSEFASYESFERLVGNYKEPGLLTAAVRNQPFSIVLFDEIEKAHFNVFDLCLQIFDAGRLTDGHGRTANFCKSIIILTSNVGAAIPEGPGVGFLRTDDDRGLEDQIHRELGRLFRPEFLNRIDRIVCFRPLSEETAERIARREIEKVLARSGIKDRRLRIEIDPAVLPILLRDGYSRSFGARPLKRTVERLVVLPLARLIAVGEVTAESVVRLTAQNRHVRVQVIAHQDAEQPAAVEPVESHKHTERMASLDTKFNGLRANAANLVAEKSDLLAQTSVPGFWNQRDAAERLSDKICELEGILTRLNEAGRGLDRLAESMRASKKNGARLSQLSDRIADVELRAAHLDFLMDPRSDSYRGDAVVILTRIDARHAAVSGVERLARMYRRFADRHRFEVAILDDQLSEARQKDSIVLHISGVGAYALLANENGLHDVSQKNRGPRGRSISGQEIVRVEVLPARWNSASLNAKDVVIESLDATESSVGRLDKTRRSHFRLLHKPSMLSIHVATHLPRPNLLEHLSPFLAARIAAAENSAHVDGSRVVRRYRLGTSPLVRDPRIGKGSGRVERILDGRLDQFVIPLAIDEINLESSKSVPDAAT